MQPTDRKSSVDVQTARPAKDATLQQRLKVADCLRRIDPPKVLEVPLRPTSTDPRQPQFFSLPPSRHSNPPPLPPAGISKAQWKSALGSGGFLPPNLMNELNCVLTKSGRSATARSAEEEEKR